MLSPPQHAHSFAVIKGILRYRSIIAKEEKAGIRMVIKKKKKNRKRMDLATKAMN